MHFTDIFSFFLQYTHLAMYYVILVFFQHTLAYLCFPIAFYTDSAACKFHVCWFFCTIPVMWYLVIPLTIILSICAMAYSCIALYAHSIVWFYWMYVSCVLIFCTIPVIWSLQWSGVSQYVYVIIACHWYLVLFWRYTYLCMPRHICAYLCRAIVFILVQNERLFICAMKWCFKNDMYVIMAFHRYLVVFFLKKIYLSLHASAYSCIPVYGPEHCTYYWLFCMYICLMCVYYFAQFLPFHILYFFDNLIISAC